MRATDYYWLFLAPQKPIVFLGLNLHPRRVSFDCRLHICFLLGNLWSAYLLEPLFNWRILLSTCPLPILLFKLRPFSTKYVTTATPSIYIIWNVFIHSYFHSCLLRPLGHRNSDRCWAFISQSRDLEFLLVLNVPSCMMDWVTRGTVKVLLCFLF